jgi:hypothetical protein
MSMGRIGHQPSICSASPGVSFAVLVSIYRVAVEAVMQANVTVRIRARMTEGASRFKVGDGRVAADK